jgi:Fic family protein
MSALQKATRAITTSASDALLHRIRGEYLEMPGLRVTFAQACRLWQLDEATCEAVLNVLVEQRFLRKSGCGYVAAVSGR